MPWHLQEVVHTFFVPIIALMRGQLNETSLCHSDNQHVDVLLPAVLGLAKGERHVAVFYHMLDLAAHCWMRCQYAKNVFTTLDGTYWSTRTELANT